MAVHRPRRRRTRRTAMGREVGRLLGQKGVMRGTVDAGSDLGAAAKVIADEASRLARGQGLVETADAISVDSDETSATVWVQTGAAYPNEVEGVKHPVFGHGPWVTNQHRPFLGPACDAKAGDAMKRYSERISRLIKEAGFR